MAASKASFPVKPKPYRPSIRSLQEDWARRLALQRMLERSRKGKPPRPKTITDNSEPWMENPDSVADYWNIASRVNETVARWRTKTTPTDSSDS